MLWLWYLKSLTRTGEGTTRKSLREVEAEWATTGNLSHRCPRPWETAERERVTGVVHERKVLCKLVLCKLAKLSHAFIEL